MNTFRLHILAADRVFFEGDCTSLIVPTAHGQYGVQARHSNMIAALVPGQLTFRCPDAPERLAAVSAGMIKVEDNDVLVLVDAAERPEDIDAIRARRKADEAREILLQKKSRQEYRTAQATLARALNRLRVKEHREL